jgi:hypothetical protein
VTTWGIQKFTEVSIGKQALNFLGHWGIGLGTGLAWSALVWWLSAVPPWTIIVVGALPELIREIVQGIKRRKLNLLDRIRDVVDSVVGSLTAYGIAHFYI